MAVETTSRSATTEPARDRRWPPSRLDGTCTPYLVIAPFFLAINFPVPRRIASKG